MVASVAARELAQLDSPIRVGILGVGSVGTGLVRQAQITPGIECVAVAEIDPNKAVRVLDGFDLGWSRAETPQGIARARAAGKIALCESALIIAESTDVDVVIDGTNAVAAAGEHGLQALESGKHLLMMNAEADLTFGPAFLQAARSHGVVYSSCSGDQPAVISDLIGELRLWGLDLVMAGNIKGFLDRYTNPILIAPEADKRALDHKMCSSYSDGTKLNIEMAIVANGFGMGVDVTGMHGPRADHVLDLLEKIDLERIHAKGVPMVDYVLGAEPPGGVFVVGYSRDSFQQFSLDWFPSRHGRGPFYLFHRPHHLCHLESMSSVCRAFCHGESILEPRFGFRTNVVAYAKQDLDPGAILDGNGGFACYGLIENEEAGGVAGLPICLSEGQRLERRVARDERIGFDDVAWRTDDPRLALYRRALDASRALAG